MTHTNSFVFSLLAAAFFFLSAGVAVASEITGGLSNQGIVPVDPSSVTAMKTGDAQITVAWSSVNGVDGYSIYRIKNGAAGAVAVTTTASTNYVDNGLDPATYSYQVQSFLGNLSSPIADIPTVPIVISVPVSPPAAPPVPPASGGGGGGGGGFVTTAPLRGDVTNDGKVNFFDFSALLVDWGKTNPATFVNSHSDLNGDGKVDFTDFTLLLVNWSV